jgi:hypothetical protein
MTDCRQNEKIATFRINANKTACVSSEVEYLPMDSCPHGVKVIGLSRLGVARIDTVSNKTTDLVGWAPLPKVPQWMKGVQ